MSEEAVKALEALGFGRGEVADRFGECIGWRGLSPSTPDHFQCEFCGSESLDTALIHHGAGCPVLLCRSAADSLIKHHRRGMKEGR